MEDMKKLSVVVIDNYNEWGNEIWKHEAVSHQYPINQHSVVMIMFGSVKRDKGIEKEKRNVNEGVKGKLAIGCLCN